MKYEYLYNDKSKSAIQFVNCGYEDCINQYTYTQNNYYSIYYLSSGSCKLIYNNKLYTIIKGQSFIIYPSTYFVINSINSLEFSFSWISFCGNEIKYALKECNISNKDVLLDITNDNIYISINSCCNYFKNSKTPSNFKLSSYCNIILWILEQYKKNDVNLLNSKALILDRAIQYIELNYTKPITITDISEYVNFDRTYIYKIFKEKFSISVQRFIINYRINVAKKLLKNTNHSIKEIAALVGISDQYYFSKLFKKITSMSPKEYKNNKIKY